MAIPQAAKRISKLPLMDGDEILNIQESTLKGTDPGGSTYTHSDAWGIGVDSLCRNDGTAIGPDGLIPGMHVGVDDGTAFIPMSRIAMRDTNGKIPASMLPSHIDDMMYGELTFSSSAATFVEHFNDPDGTEHTRTYVSPNDGSHPVPPDNIIYCDTIGANPTDLQYRYDASIPTGSKFGFMEVPGSRALTSTYGIELTQDQSYAKVTVNAKMADFIASGGVSTAETVNSTASNLPLASGSIEKSVLDVVTESNRLTKVTGLIGGARYAVNIQIECIPVTLSANIIDVSVTCGTVPTMKRQMDMAGPNNAASQTPSVTVLDYFCEFKNGDNNTELTVTIAAEEAITVKTTRFTIFELL